MSRILVFVLGLFVLVLGLKAADFTPERFAQNNDLLASQISIVFGYFSDVLGFIGKVLNVLLEGIRAPLNWLQRVFGW